jgi:peroxiredoxin
MTKLLAGMQAIDFEGADIHGNKIKLSDYKGKKIILGFYRHKGCPFCNKRVHQIMAQNLRLKQSGVQLVFLFESANEKLKASVFHQGISPWPLIGNPEKDIYQLYKVEFSTRKMLNTILHMNPLEMFKTTRELGLTNDSDASLNLVPADFFINEDFIIVKAHYGEHLDDHVSLEELKKFAGIDGLFSGNPKRK